MSETAPPTTVTGVVAVINRGDQLLMIQRAAGVTAPGAWCFPGGAVEPGETSAEALRRELREELGADIHPGEPLWTWLREDGLLRLEWWSAALNGDSLCASPTEVQAYRWMTPDEIRRTPGVLPNNLSFLDFWLR